MKKRQKPYLLIAVLVLAGGAVAFMNTPQSNPNMPQPEETPKTGEKVDVPDQKDVAKQVAENMKKAGAPKDAMRGPLGAEADNAPLIMKTKSAPYKPKPSDSATSTQWYTNETPKELPAQDQGKTKKAPAPNRDLRNPTP
jgi:hypothetical protein